MSVSVCLCVALVVSVVHFSAAGEKFRFVVVRCHGGTVINYSAVADRSTN